MAKFMTEDFLLHSKAAKTLYHTYARDLPIVDYHCHVNPRDIAENVSFENISQVWLGGDHYKWRLLRAQGFAEGQITGLRGKDDWQLFQNYAACMPKAIGNPLYHWTHLELQRYFGIDKVLDEETAEEIYSACNQRLQQPDMCVRGILDQSRVQLLCTTDDPVDDLRWHAQIQQDQNRKVKVLPTFRPDLALQIQGNGFCAYLEKLGQAAGVEIHSFKDLCNALRQRIAFFDSMGCKASDHGLARGVFQPGNEADADRILQKARTGEKVDPVQAELYQSLLLQKLAQFYTQHNWVMQIHFGCHRNASGTQFDTLGPDMGFDCILADSRPEKLGPLLDSMERAKALPKTILYSLNPADGPVLVSLSGSFLANAEIPCKVQVGSAWWFNDTKVGMEKQLSDFANGSLLGHFVGMLTDSRSFLSYPRHEYFRRILCNYLGNLVEQGEYPEDYQALGTLVQDICYHNTCRFFGFDL